MPFTLWQYQNKEIQNASSHSFNIRVCSNRIQCTTNSVKNYFARKNQLWQESNNNIMHFYCLNRFLAVIAASIHSNCSTISALTQRQSLISVIKFSYFYILYHTFQKIVFIAVIYGQRMVRMKEIELSPKERKSKIKTLHMRMHQNSKLALITRERVLSLCINLTHSFIVLFLFVSVFFFAFDSFFSIEKIQICYKKPIPQ